MKNYQVTFEDYITPFISNSGRASSTETCIKKFEAEDDVAAWKKVDEIVASTKGADRDYKFVHYPRPNTVVLQEVREIERVKEADWV